MTSRGFAAALENRKMAFFMQGLFWRCEASFVMTQLEFDGAICMIHDSLFVGLSPHTPLKA